MSKKTGLIAILMLLVVAYLLLSPRMTAQQTDAVSQTTPPIAPVADTEGSAPAASPQDTGDARDAAADAPGDDVPANADVADDNTTDQPDADAAKPMELPPAEGQ